MEQYQGSVDSPAGPALQATITVYDSTGAIASIYSDNSSTVKDNPFSTDLLGMFDFYAANGKYAVTHAATGYATYTKHINLYDRSDDTDLVNLAQSLANNAVASTAYTDAALVTANNYTDTEVGAALVTANSYTDASADVLNDAIDLRVRSIPTIADLRNTVGAYDGQLVQVAGYYAVGDGGGGPVRRWDAASTAADDGGAVIDPVAAGAGRWVWIYSGQVNVKWLGAKGNGIADDIVSLQVAITNFRNVYVPEGTYLISVPLVFSKPTRIVGSGIFTVISPMTGFGASDDAIKIVPTGHAQKRLYTLENFVIEPQTSGQGRHAVHIDLTAAGDFIANFVMTRIQTGEVGGRGFYLTNPTNVDGFFTSSIFNNKIKHGIFMQRAGDSLFITENVLSGRNAGIEFDSVPGAAIVVIEKNNITNSGGAILAKDYAQQIKIMHNQIEQIVTYDGTLAAGDAACIAIIATVARYNQMSVIENNNINNRGNVGRSITAEYTNSLSISKNVIGARTAVGFETDHLYIKSNAKNTRIYSDNHFISVDTTNKTPLRITDDGQGTCGTRKTLTAFSNGWAVLDAVNFPTYTIKDPTTNLVSVYGSVSGGTDTAGTVILTLPSGHTPVIANYNFGVIIRQGAVYTSDGILAVDGTGTISIRKASTLTGSTSLDGISFYAQDIP